MNKTHIKIIKKMSREYIGGWVSHLADALWAYRSLSKFAMGFYPFSLVYGMEAIRPVELMVPSLRILQAQKKENEKDVFTVEMCEDLEGLDEKKGDA